MSSSTPPPPQQQQQQKRTALLLCDIQPDALNSLPPSSRDSLLRSIRVAIAACRLVHYPIIHSGLRFASGYDGVNPQHKMYGSLRRLNEKLGDAACHWFMKGYPGGDIDKSIIDAAAAAKSSFRNTPIITTWRDRHLVSWSSPNTTPTNGNNDDDDAPSSLLSTLHSLNISKVILAGTKASGSIQSTAQVLMDAGLSITILREAVQDDTETRRVAILEHLLPLYATVVDLALFIDEIVGLASFVEDVGNDDDDVVRDLVGVYSLAGMRGCTDCGREGHGRRYIQFLLERGGWYRYPTQVWYGRLMQGEFRCPLGKAVVDFADEPEFSRIAMYVAGREWVDEKDKLLRFAGGYMPETFQLNRGVWVGGMAPPECCDNRNDRHDDATNEGVWFVKETDKNFGGDSIIICRHASEILTKAKPDRRYVVQQHVKDAILTDDGHKAHIKFYILLTCEEDGVTWTLYTYKSPLLSISPTKWSPDDLSHDTQVTIHRHPVPPSETDGWKQHWPGMYDKCRAGTADVLEKAIRDGKLKGRLGKKQFEVFSCDWMPDQHGNIWLFEFNMSPAVCQKEFDDKDKRDSRRGWLMERDEAMMREALDIVMPWEGGSAPGLWDAVGEIKGVVYLDGKKEVSIAT